MVRQNQPIVDRDSRKTKRNKPKPKFYRLSLIDNSTHRNIRSVHFTKTGAITTLCGGLFALILLIYCLVAFTPLRTSIPGYPNASTKRAAIENAVKIDSLENAMLRWNMYAVNLSRVLSGESTVDIKTLINQPSQFAHLSSKSEEELRASDSLLRQTVINEERFGLDESGRRVVSVEGMHFFTPVKGVITTGFSDYSYPYAEIVTQSGSIVSAVLDGTVVYAGNNNIWGHVLILQHADNIVSIYANNSELLCSTGMHVDAGSPIAIVGSRPGDSQRYYLHFELWQNGQPLLPTNYINF